MRAVPVPFFFNSEMNVFAWPWARGFGHFAQQKTHIFLSPAIKPNPRALYDIDQRSPLSLSIDRVGKVMNYFC